MDNLDVSDVGDESGRVIRVPKGRRFPVFDDRYQYRLGQCVIAVSVFFTAALYGAVYYIYDQWFKSNIGTIYVEWDKDNHFESIFWGEQARLVNESVSDDISNIAAYKLRSDSERSILRRVHEWASAEGEAGNLDQVILGALEEQAFVAVLDVLEREVLQWLVKEIESETVSVSGYVVVLGSADSLGNIISIYGNLQREFSKKMPDVGFAFEEAVLCYPKDGVFWRRFAVTVGGNLSEQEAESIASAVRESGIVRDAYTLEYATSKILCGQDAPGQL